MGFSNLSDFLSDAFCLREKIKVIGASGLGIRSRHIEAAERMRAHHRARALAIEVQIADVETLSGLAQMLGVVREDGAGEPVLRVVGELERVLEIARPGHRQDRSEDLLLEDLRLRI